MSQEPPTVPVPPPSSGPRRGAARSALVGILGVLPPVAVAVLAVVAAAWLAVLSGLLVLFGLGLVVVVALAVLGAGLLARRGRTPGWIVLPLLAVALPAVAVAASGERVATQHGVRVHVPLVPEEIPASGYRTGLGEQLVDLRSLTIPAGRTVALRARSDLDRTIVALPLNACWNLDVRWRTGRLWLPRTDEHRWIDGVDRRGEQIDAWFGRGRREVDLGFQEDPAWHRNVGFFEGRIALFGRVRRESQGRWVSRVADPRAPTLRIDLRSAGSSFAVRDYPADVGPLVDPGWPLSLMPPASPDQLRERWSSPGRSRESARRWAAYRTAKAAFVARGKRLLAGGCGRRTVTP